MRLFSYKVVHYSRYLSDGANAEADDDATGNDSQEYIEDGAPERNVEKES